MKENEMACITVTPIHRLELSSAELVLISKGLNLLTTLDGRKLPDAQMLRDTLTRQRANQTMQMFEQAKDVLAKLPPRDHDYFAEGSVS